MRHTRGDLHFPASTDKLTRVVTFVGSFVRAPIRLANVYLLGPPPLTPASYMAMSLASILAKAALSQVGSDAVDDGDELLEPDGTEQGFILAVGAAHLAFFNLG